MKKSTTQIVVVQGTNARHEARQEELDAIDFAFGDHKSITRMFTAIFETAEHLATAEGSNRDVLEGAWEGLAVIASRMEDEIAELRARVAKIAADGGAR